MGGEHLGSRKDLAEAWEIAAPGPVLRFSRPISTCTAPGYSATGRQLEAARCLLERLSKLGLTVAVTESSPTPSRPYSTPSERFPIMGGQQAPGRGYFYSRPPLPRCATGSRSAHRPRRPSRADSSAARNSRSLGADCRYRQA